MRFSAAIPLLTAALAVASPSPKPATYAMARDDSTTVNEVAAAIQFAVQADCDLFQCANVLASAACIGAGLATGMIEAVLACVASGSSGICPCAGCIPGLNDFLADNGICT